LKKCVRIKKLVKTVERREVDSIQIMVEMIQMKVVTTQVPHLRLQILET
jgi:hypothetical protein